ncbi:hypothetical protein GUJ93_ZPchr0013g37185 [Zizania palustris]|uniref:Uncharacterized protein n=1 Tax=Zizania palustris TaxID=103762 RepID=A0A8J5WZK8_ZIZPA|nr:hypothetical protein GUJ93_ZPchr0013g37185 [Zizania palustris]
MVGNTEDDDDSVVPALEDLSKKDHAEIEAKTKELHDHMLGRYVKIGDAFVKRDVGSITITSGPPKYFAPWMPFSPPQVSFHQELARPKGSVGS